MLSDQEEEASECTQPILVERCGESNGSSAKSERSVYLNPVWVQCSHAACQKWRLLRDTFDATEVVDDWSCDMNSDKKHNKCEDAEESCGDESDDESFGFIYAPFSNGSIVWAAFDSYSAWWPAMIAPDPDENMTLQTVSPQCSTVETYHVVFFGKKPTRAWIRANKLKAFGKFDPKTEPVRDALVLRTLAQWNNNAMKEAREKAQEAFALKDIQTRLRIFGHMSYFKQLQQKCHQQLSQPSPSSVRKGKPLLKLAASQPAPTKRTKSRKKASKNAMDEDSLTIRERLMNDTITEVASGAGGVALGASVRIYEDSCAISASVTEVVEAVYNRVKNEVKMIKLGGAKTDVTSTAKKFKAPVSATEKTPAVVKKARAKKFNTPTASTSNNCATAAAIKKPRAKKPKLSSVSPADVSKNTVMTEKEKTLSAGKASEDPPRTVQQESVRDPCASEAVAPTRTDSPSKPTSTRSLASELVSLSQQLRESSFDADMDENMNIVMDVSQDSLVPPIAQSTPIMCAPLSTLDHSSQEGVDETEKRTRALCEAAVERLNSFLNLSQELLNASVDGADSMRPLSPMKGAVLSGAPVTSSMSLSQELRHPPAELNTSQEWSGGTSGKSRPPTPIRTPLAILVGNRLNSSQDVSVETDERTKAVCEQAAKRLDNFLSLSQEALNKTTDEEEAENWRPLSQTSTNDRRDSTPRKTFAPTFKPLFNKIVR